MQQSDKLIKSVNSNVHFTVDVQMYMHVNNLKGPWFSIYDVRKCEVERKTCNPV